MGWGKFTYMFENDFEEITHPEGDFLRLWMSKWLPVALLAKTLYECYIEKWVVRVVFSIGLNRPIWVVHLQLKVNPFMPVAVKKPLGLSQV